MEALIFIALSWSIGSGSCWQRASFIVSNAQKRAYCVRPRVAILHDWKQWQFLSFVSHWFQNVNIRCVSFYLFFNTRARGRFVCVTAYHLSRLWLGNFSIASKIGPIIGRTHRSIAGICRCVLCVCVTENATELLSKDMQHISILWNDTIIIKDFRKWVWFASLKIAPNHNIRLGPSEYKSSSEFSLLLFWREMCVIWTYLTNADLIQVWIVTWK